VEALAVPDFSIMCLNMKYRLAALDDIPILVKMNRQLTEDEQHRNRFKSDEWFKERMETFLILVFSKSDLMSYQLHNREE